MAFSPFAYVVRIPGAACLAGLCIALYGCASDSAPEPEPELETRGSFVAIQGFSTKEPITLVRTLDRLLLENYTLMFFTIYDVHPQTFSEARELAKGHDIKIREEIRIENKAILMILPYEVVWYRTLSDEEMERIP